jgi:hypothetical protein
MQNASMRMIQLGFWFAVCPLSSLLAKQRSNGGRSQLPDTERDAFAHGQVLHALSQTLNTASLA